MVETLSYHFEQAQSYGKGYAYLWQSANKLRQRSLFEKSREYLDRAIAVEPKARAHLALYEANEKLANIYLSHSYLSHQLNDTNSATEKAHLADQIACEQHNTPLLARSPRKRHDKQEICMLCKKPTSKSNVLFAMQMKQVNPLYRFYLCTKVVRYYGKQVIQNKLVPYSKNHYDSVNSYTTLLA